MKQTISCITVVIALALLCAAGSGRASNNRHPKHPKPKHHRFVQHRKVSRWHEIPTKLKLPIGTRAARLALDYLGIRYSWGGASPRQGFDCSGFVMYVYGKLGVRLPHYTGGQYSRGRRVPYSRLAPGDLVFFSGLGHVGMYIGRGRYVHAPHSGTVVQVNRLGARRASFVGARRL
jgi:cell wall-associated NlpC family hydrolase